ncbi:MAG: SulP family inorganic anion transporter [Halieaceae bacterium]|nr:SulP family inorganic anion transporter [Halieaceae bacterium]
MSSQLARVVQELRGDVLAGKTIESLTAGVTSGLGLLVAQIAFATFIFSGPLAAYSSQGVGLVLFGNFAACLIMALAGGYRGVVAGLSPAMVIGMAVIGSSMDAEGEALFVTVAGALILSAVITGLSCLMLGRFRLANLLRFIPYPVSAGFVAGIGGVVCLAAMSMMGAELHWSAIPELLEPSRLWRWGPGVVFGAALYIAMKRWGNALILPISVALAVVGYHIALTALGVSGDEARATGLLLTSTTDGNLWPALGPADIKRVEWAAMATQIPNMMVLILVGFICVVMNLAGLEVAANQELDWDREFQVGGVASVVAGLGGGTIATVVVPASLRSKLLGAETSLTGISAALVVGSALFFGDGMLELVPSPLVGGILVFAGLGMLDEGLVRSHRRLPKTEFSIIALIFVIIIAFGLLEGVGAGMVATLVFFTVRLSSVDPIESCFTACGRQSNKARPVPERAILRNEGERVLAYLLRGYIFFGSASPLADRLGKSLGGPSRPHCLLLDFAAVSGFDFSAVNVLSRLLQAAHAADVQVVLSALPEQLRAGLERNLPPAVFAQLLVEPDADLALERCEETIIEKWKANAGLADRQRASLLEQTGDDLERYLERQIDFEDLEGELRDWLEVREYAGGDAMVRPGSTRQDLQLLQAGRASAYDASGARLYQCGPGDAVLPMGVLEGRVTTVVAEETCRTMVLTPATRHRLETDRKDLAFKLYQYLLSANFQAESSVGQQQASAQAGDEDGVELQP